MRSLGIKQMERNNKIKAFSQYDGLPRPILCYARSSSPNYLLYYRLFPAKMIFSNQLKHFAAKPSSYVVIVRGVPWTSLFQLFSAMICLATPQTIMMYCTQVCIHSCQLYGWLRYPDASIPTAGGCFQCNLPPSARIRSEKLLHPLALRHLHLLQPSSQETRNHSSASLFQGLTARTSCAPFAHRIEFSSQQTVDS